MTDLKSRFTIKIRTNKSSIKLFEEEDAMKRISIILLALLGMIMTVYAGGKQEAAEKVSAPTVIRFL